MEIKNIFIYIIISILLLNSSTAFLQSFKDFTPYQDNTNVGQYGEKFILNGNYILKNVSFATGTTSDYACISNFNTWEVIGCSPIISLMANFSLVLNSSVLYVAWAHKNGSIQTTKYNTTIVYPYLPIESTKIITWLTALSLGNVYPPPNNGTNNTNWAGQLFYGFENINVSSPTITTTQNPLNFSYQNAISNNNSVTAEVTDTSGINTSTVKLNITKVDLDVYINGTKQPINYTKTYTNSSGDFYTWSLNENDILGSTQNLNAELFENTTHSYSILSGSNNWLKIEFLNVSNYANLNILEYMSDNDTPLSSISTYYYCNSSYSSGNPVGNSNCVLVASVDNNAQFNHTHNGGFSKHKIFSLVNIGGYIGTVKITPVSYILKRGTTTGDRYYYLNITSRENATQLSGNNGNTWTSQAYTVDSHIHFIYNTSVFSYRVCATNLNGFSACSSQVYNPITIFALPPSPVTIYNPIAGNYYADLIIINHSVSNQPLGSISLYKYYYSVAGVGAWVNFYNNTITLYSWDVTSLISKAYDLRIDAVDNFNLTSSSFVFGFNINNTLTNTEILLTEIKNNLDTSNILQQEISEAVKMIAVSMFMTLLFFASITIIILTKEAVKLIGGILLWIFFALFPFTIATLNFFNDLEVLLTLKIVSDWMLVIIPILMGLYCFYLIFSNKSNSGKKDKDMYDIY